jgi:hypothetical protein
MDENGEMMRTNGIVHTIKDGVVTENARLMDEVARMVRASKQNADTSNPVSAPFVSPDGR